MYENDDNFTSDPLKLVRKYANLIKNDFSKQVNKSICTYLPEEDSDFGNLRMDVSDSSSRANTAFDMEYKKVKAWNIGRLH